MVIYPIPHKQDVPQPLFDDSTRAFYEIGDRQNKLTCTIDATKFEDGTALGVTNLFVLFAKASNPNEQPENIEINAETQDTIISKLKQVDRLQIKMSNTMRELETNEVWKKLLKAIILGMPTSLSQLLIIDDEKEQSNDVVYNSVFKLIKYLRSRKIRVFGLINYNPEEDAHLELAFLPSHFFFANSSAKALKFIKYEQLSSITLFNCDMELANFRSYFVEMKSKEDDDDEYFSIPHYFSFETFQFVSDNENRFNDVKNYFTTVLRSRNLANLRVQHIKADNSNTILTGDDFPNQG